MRRAFKLTNWIIAKEIQRSLTHRARLRKAYFKMLEQEGETVPEKDKKNVTEKEDKESDSEDEEDGDNEEKEDLQAEDESNGQDFFDESEKPEPRNEEPSKQTFKDRMRIKKERKKTIREQRAKMLEAKKQEHERREELRLKHKKQMTKYTPRGQPVMGSRINRLLDKIKETA